jgi:SAM-dependent methyltransferase
MIENPRSVGVIGMNRGPLRRELPAITPVNVPAKPRTMWETIATTRWGRYTTRIAEHAVMAACNAAGAPASALEVGCEGGRWSQFLAERGWTLTCTDINPDVLTICRQRVPDANCILVSPDGTTLPSPTASVRLLLCLEVFPVMDSEWFGSEASRVLEEGGVLVGVALNRASIRGAFVRLKEHLQGGPHGFYRSAYARRRLALRNAGFDIVLERGYCWFPFSRASNSPLIPFVTRLERWLLLDRIPLLSPWVVFVARKKPRT